MMFDASLISDSSNVSHDKLKLETWSETWLTALIYTKYIHCTQNYVGVTGFSLGRFRRALHPSEFSSALLSLPSALLSLSSALRFCTKDGRFLASFLDQILIKLASDNNLFRPDALTSS